jgi:glycosyltransferase involved in cell wall biosynthesis
MYLNRPAGGFKVVYEYANRLQARGHSVTVIHPRNLDPQPGAWQKLKSVLWPYKVKWRDRGLVPWLAMHPEVRLSLVADLGERFIPDGDAIFATAYQTAFHVAGYDASKGRKFYLIQHHETWLGPEEEVNRTWKLPLHKIVISQWLMGLAREFGANGDVNYIPNGIDFSLFKLLTPIAARPRRVAMLAHPFAWKGMADGLAALEMVRAQAPELEATLYGAHPRPAEIPAWIEYVEHPTPDKLLALYNSCAVFLHTSWSEGWGLPPAEAMACGCALVAAANHGVRDFAEHDVTALLAPIKQPAGLARQLLRVVRDDALRLRIAEAGRRRIQQFTWDRAVNSLEMLLVERAGDAH